MCALDCGRRQCSRTRKYLSIYVSFYICICVSLYLCISVSFYISEYLLHMPRRRRAALDSDYYVTLEWVAQLWAPSSWLPASSCPCSSMHYACHDAHYVRLVLFWGRGGVVQLLMGQKNNGLKLPWGRIQHWQTQWRL